MSSLSFFTTRILTGEIIPQYAVSDGSQLGEVAIINVDSKNREETRKRQHHAQLLVMHGIDFAHRSRRGLQAHCTVHDASVEGRGECGYAARNAVSRRVNRSGRGGHQWDKAWTIATVCGSPTSPIAGSSRSRPTRKGLRRGRAEMDR
jgi:hypothetical protein